MDTSEFDARIKQAEAERDNAFKRMAAATERFSDAVLEAYTAWLDPAAEAAVRRNAEDATSVGAEGLARLKQRVAGLKAEARDLVRKHVTEAIPWAHVDREWNPPGGSSNPFRRRRGSDAVDDPVRRLLETLGSVFVEEGISEIGQWRSDSYYSVPYPYGFEWTSAMKEAINEYANEFDVLQKALHDRRKAVDEKTRAQAAGLWENA